MEINNVIASSSKTFGDLPPPDPYPGYVDLLIFSLDLSKQLNALFSGNPPGITTDQGQEQMRQIILMLHSMAKYCQGSPWAAQEQSLENAFYAYVANPSVENLDVLKNGISYFSYTDGQHHNPPIIDPSEAQDCIKDILKNFLEFVATDSNWPKDPSSSGFSEVQGLMILMMDILSSNPSAEGNYEGNFWKDLISYKDPSGKQWGVLPDGETFVNVLYQYINPLSPGALPSQADVEAVLQALINDLN